jgi:hypothetical protein
MMIVTDFPQTSQRPAPRTCTAPNPPLHHHPTHPGITTQPIHLHRFQDREPTEDIGFHYDKDEGIASNQMRMVYPHTSTVRCAFSDRNLHSMVPLVPTPA